MPFTPEELKQLADAGGFVLFLLAVVGGTVGIWRRWVVPGWFYDQEHEARMRAEAENRTLSVTAARLTGEMAALRGELKRERDSRRDRG